MAKISITFPDGAKKQHDKGSTALEIIKKDIGEGLARAALAAKLDDELIDLTTPINKSGKLTILTFKDKEGKEVFWHSASHLMTQAILRLFKTQNIGLGVGSAIDDGFYQDYDIKELHPDDLPKIEAEMKKIVNEKQDITQKDVPKKEALEFYKKDPYKTELANAVPDKKVSMYSQGEFNNLCKGPHVPNTSYIKAFKLMKIAGAYWRGDSDKNMLTRVYGIAFPDKKELKEYLHLLEEAEKRNHRKIGRKMDLFSFHEEAPGMPFFHNKGTFIFNKLVEYVSGIMRSRDYEINKTPLILSKSLWHESGHWDHYKDNMYFTKIDDRDFAVKPMNCPGNVLIFKTKTHSYRELPIRAGEFGLVHRHELSGVLNGLFRVRCFTQDDAHVFCMEEQVEHEIKDLIDFADVVYKRFGFEYHVELSTKPEKAMGDPKLWDLAEGTLKKVLKELNMEYKINEGDGAFYGPKIDFHLKDALGRSWQCGTIQLDFSMPEKFDLNYEGKDGKKHRPVMLHRTILGSVERFMGIITEHFAGRFPLWLAPVQAVILTVADRFNGYAEEVKTIMEENGLRVEFDSRAESVSYKVREAQLQEIPLIITIGEKEEKAKTLTIRTLDGKLYPNSKITELVDKVLENVEKKAIKINL
ncbi:threonine--tRNA ligase [Candidatus Woesearchaeota archaeon]|nr:threonine--tRNA ligase [Candidatus Woesearchaeota archaeon]|tara:strand:+ start:12587 stop:14509 length:1923 start_codon:yes stop_codon:yes gene_type:complete